MPRADFIFTNHGSIWLCIPQHAQAEQHINERVGPETQRWARSSIVVEPRYVADLRAQLEAEGFEVQ